MVGPSCGSEIIPTLNRKLPFADRLQRIAYPFFWKGPPKALAPSNHFPAGQSIVFFHMLVSQSVLHSTHHCCWSPHFVNKNTCTLGGCSVLSTSRGDQPPLHLCNPHQTHLQAPTPIAVALHPLGTLQQLLHLMFTGCVVHSKRILRAMKRAAKGGMYFCYGSLALWATFLTNSTSQGG